MDSRIMIRDGGPYGPDLSLPAAIARLCDGEQVTVAPVDASTPGGDPRGEPGPGFDVTVYPARTAYTRLEPPKANWAGIGSRPAADAALFAETLTLASQLATYASLGQPTAGQAAAIGAGHGRDAARRALGASTPDTCRAIVKGLDDGDQMACDLFRAPALSGEHGIGYDAVDLAADLRPRPRRRRHGRRRGGVCHGRRRSVLGGGRTDRTRVCHDGRPHAGKKQPVNHQPADPGYQRGDRIALEHTTDPYTRLTPGTRGTVTGYDPQHGQLHVAWDDGSTPSPTATGSACSPPAPRLPRRRTVSGRVPPAAARRPAGRPAMGTRRRTPPTRDRAEQAAIGTLLHLHPACS